MPERSGAPGSPLGPRSRLEQPAPRALDAGIGRLRGNIASASGVPPVTRLDSGRLRFLNSTMEACRRTSPQVGPWKMRWEHMAKVVGIDLGTTNSVVAVLEA